MMENGDRVAQLDFLYLNFLIGRSNIIFQYRDRMKFLVCPISELDNHVRRVSNEP
jgi:hypothetical protein